MRLQLAACSKSCRAELLLGMAQVGRELPIGPDAINGSYCLRSDESGLSLLHPISVASLLSDGT